MRSARSSLALAAKEFRAAGDASNTARTYLLSSAAAQLDGDPRAATKFLTRARAEARSGAPAQVEAMIAFAEAEHAARQLAIGDAHVAASRAWAAAHRAGNASLASDVEHFEAALATPIARTSNGLSLDLAALAEMLRVQKQIVIDGRRGAVFLSGSVIAELASRPPLLALLSALAEVAPRSVSSRDLARAVFGTKTPNASHDTKVRAQVNRLRKLIGKKLGDVVFDEGSFRWEARFPVVVLVPHALGPEARLEALFADGRARAMRLVARDLGESARTTDRALSSLAKSGVLRSTGQGPRKRWMLASSASLIALSTVLPDASP